jgi:hypothetical protein
MKDQYLRASNRSIPELISDPLTTSNVTDEATARKELTSRGMLIPASGASVEALAEALLEFTLQAPNLTRLHTDIIRAIAVLLFEADHELKAQRIAETTSKYLTDVLGRLEKVAATCEVSSNVTSTSEITTILSISDKLAMSLENSSKIQSQLKRERDEGIEGARVIAVRVEEAADTVYGATQELNNTIQLLTPSLDSVKTKMNELTTTLSKPQTMPAPPNPTHTSLLPRTNSNGYATYSTVAATTPPLTTSTPRVTRPSPTDEAVARSAIRARQVLLDLIPGNKTFPPNLSHADTVAKLREALKTTLPPGGTGDIKALLQLRNGGLMVEMDSEETANRLKNSEDRNKFLKALDHAVTIKDRTYTVIVQYLPIHMQIDRPGLLRLIESKNELEDNSLISMRWVKPPNKRTPGQLMAFASLQVNNADTANLIIKNGLYIDQQLVKARKDRKEPTRCAKCQHYGHIARNCSANRDTCATCANNHRTSECNSFRSPWCANCRNNGHSSWSRGCPEFGKRCKDLDEKYPENSMPYFPTSESWTHTSTPPKANPYQKITPPTPPKDSTPNAINSPKRQRQTVINSATFFATKPPPAPAPAPSHPRQPSNLTPLPPANAKPTQSIHPDNNRHSKSKVTEPELEPSPEPTLALKISKSWGPYTPPPPPFHSSSSSRNVTPDPATAPTPTPSPAAYTPLHFPSSSPPPPSPTIAATATATLSEDPRSSTLVHV